VKILHMNPCQLILASDRDNDAIPCTEASIHLSCQGKTTPMATRDLLTGLHTISPDSFLTHSDEKDVSLFKESPMQNTILKFQVFVY